MTLQEFYQLSGGKYSEVKGRMLDDGRIVKFLKMFLKDNSMEIIRNALQNDDIKEAFRGAHTLKGVTQNLGLVNLYKVSSELTELLRDEEMPSKVYISKIMQKTEEEYAACIQLIELL